MTFRSMSLALLLVAAGCTKTTKSQPSETKAPEKSAAPAEASPPKQPAEGEVPSPPKRDDDADRASKNGLLEAEIGGVPVVVQYGRPSVNGRDVFGDLVPYGEIWRTGADEATTLTLAEDATLAGEPVEAGTYALFTIPGKDEWTVILNSEPKQWGAYKHDAGKDVARVKVKPESHDPTEVLSFSAGGGSLDFVWADVKLSIPIEEKKE